MARKTFDSKGRIDSLLDDNHEELEKVEKKINKTKSSKKLNTVINFSIDVDLKNKLKTMAFFEGKYIKDIINESIIKEIGKYEKLNGEIKKI